MERTLAKYIYKSYYDLLHNDQINLDLSRLGWVKPAVIPRQYVLGGNRLIRKYLTRTLGGLFHDFEFQRILCGCGYYGPTCTSITNAAPFNVDNRSAFLTINSIRTNGIPLSGTSFPFGPGASDTGFSPSTTSGGVVVNITGSGSPTQCIELIDSSLVTQIIPYVAAGDYTFENVVIDGGTNTTSLTLLDCTTTTTTTTTSSTTTTTTTNATIFSVIVGIDSVITNVTINGVSLSTTGATFPVGQGQDTTGHPIPSNNATVVVSITVGATPGSVSADSSDGNVQCQLLASSGTYTFTGVVIDTQFEADIVIDNTACL